MPGQRLGYVRVSSNAISIADVDAGTATNIAVTVSVPFSTVNLTATRGAACTAGVDYITTAGTLTFVPTDTSETIVVPICGDFAIEGAETFRVDLGAPVNATINDGQGTGSITDDDVAGTISFTAATAKIDENGGQVQLTVQRTGGNASGVSVQFGTGDQTAQAGSDFTSTTGTLTFGANETTKTITVPIVNVPADTQDETFTVTLANPRGGAALGNPNVMTVTIVAIVQPQGGTPPQDDTDPPRKNTRESKDVRSLRKNSGSASGPTRATATTWPPRGTSPKCTWMPARPTWCWRTATARWWCASSAAASARSSGWVTTSRWTARSSTSSSLTPSRSPSRADEQASTSRRDLSRRVRSG